MRKRIKKGTFKTRDNLQMKETEKLPTPENYLLVEKNIAIYDEENDVYKYKHEQKPE